MTDEIVEVHAVVQGLVQGVGFRYSTKKIADSLGLKGTVKNTNHGHVEIYVQGSQTAIEELFSRLKSAVGKVETISLTQTTAKNRFNNFQIIY